MCWPSIVDGIHLFKGVSDTTMIHGQGWQFIRLGRYLERAYATATLLEVYQPDLLHAQEREHSGYQYLELVGLLRCCTAFEAYCQVYTADLTPDRILEFLLLNRDFPHAIRYCVDGMRHAIESIQRTGGRRPPDELTAVIGRLHAMLGYTTIGEILAGETRRISAHHPRAVHADSRADLPLLRALLDPVRAGDLEGSRTE